MPLEADRFFNALYGDDIPSSPYSWVVWKSWQLYFHERKTFLAVRSAASYSIFCGVLKLAGRDSTNKGNCISVTFIDWTICVLNYLEMHMAWGAMGSDRSRNVPTKHKYKHKDKEKEKEKREKDKHAKGKSVRIYIFLFFFRTRW